MATTKALRDELDQLDDIHLTCRDLGHSWSVVGYYNPNGASTVARSLRCTRCTCIRDDRWRTNGERIRANYDHPDGYLIKGYGRIAPVDVRVTVLRRVKVYATKESMMQALARRSG